MKNETYHFVSPCFSGIVLSEFVDARYSFSTLLRAIMEYPSCRRRSTSRRSLVAGGLLGPVC